MGASEVYPDVLGDAVSHSSQRLTQLGSLVTAAATMEVRRRAQASALKAARGEHELRVLREQERAARQAARVGWAPAYDARWLAQADLLQVAGVWGTAVVYANADPEAAAAVRKCEDRLRVLHPYAMARYDRLRGEGTGAVEAMQQAVPLFGRAPHARPGDSAAERRELDGPVELDSAEDVAADQDELDVRAVSTHGHRDRTTAQLAAESFPCTAADGVAATSPRTQVGRSSTRIAGAHRIRHSRRSL